MQIAQQLILPSVEGQPPVVFNGPLNNKFVHLADVVNQAMPIFFAISGIALFIYLVWGGFDFLMSMGDPKKAEAGKNKITHAIIGIIIIFAAYWILQITDIFFGFKFF